MNIMYNGALVVATNKNGYANGWIQSRVSQRTNCNMEGYKKTQRTTVVKNSGGKRIVETRIVGKRNNETTNNMKPTEKVVRRDKWANKTS